MDITDRLTGLCGTSMKFRYVIYASAFFVLAYLILKNPAGYETAANKFTQWFSKSFSAFGRIGKSGSI